MNISITKLVILLAFLPTMMYAQNLEHHIVGLDQTLELEYISEFLPLSVSDAPDFGTYTLSSEPYGASPTGLYHLDYTPNMGYLGPDTIRILLQNDPPFFNLVLKTIAIDVVPANVVAYDDFYPLLPGNTLTVDVLANDFGTSAPFLEFVSLSNNIDAIIVGNSIEISSDGSYTGIAQFSYTTCIDALTCDIGIVSVFISPAGTSLDEVSIGTNRETIKKGLLPLGEGYTVPNAPDHGTIGNYGEGTVDYLPSNNFVGTDTFEIAYNTNTGFPSIRTFYIDVFDTPAPLSFAVADEAEVGINGITSIAVLENDQAEDLFIQQIPQGPSNGSVSVIGEEIEYTADAGFTGVDHFTYKTCTPMFDCEITDVYVFVDNQVPESDGYILSTVINNAMVIDYPSNLTDWEFVVNNATTLEGGTLEYHDGFWSGQVAGQNVEGFNLLVYFPPSNWVGDDEFTVEYCYLTNCQNIDLFVKVIEDPNPNVNAHCVTECVWPGDADGNGIVDIKDALTIGYCSGEVGPARSNPDVIWYGQAATDWDENIPGSNRNLKHIDTDGDGSIMASDTLSVANFYGLFNNVTKETNPIIAAIPIYFVNQTPNPQPGDYVTIDILLGAAPTPAIDVSGISFSLNYNTDVVEPGTFDIDFAQDSWLSYDSPVMDMVVSPVTGKIDAAYTRVAGTMASGYGVVGTVGFIIQDEIDGIRQGKTANFTIGLDNAIGMDGNGQYHSLLGEDLNITIDLNEDNSFNGLNPENLVLYPNPTYETLNVHINGKNNFRTVEIIDITGRVHSILQDESDHVIMDVSQLEEGFYFLRAITDKGIITKKFEVFSQR